ncbi:MAG: restriction endonuclease subunit S [Acidobacteria bacterium]|nr:restriction endonuclease subunit S [Acidobacteriota bacterium]MCW5970694.1 restriction endonuclease subunit S [Blastocatellales bacterium]
MTKTLGDIVGIRSGYPFRGRITPAPNGAYRIIQIKDVGPDAALDLSALVRVNSIDAGSNHLVQQGDVLFIARGARRQAVALTEYPSAAIATGQFFVLTLRPDSREVVLPEYLAWYINQRTAQRYLDENVTGSNLPMIGKEVLAGLPVPIPSIRTQHRVVEIDRLNRRAQELAEEITRKRRLLAEAWALKAIERD